MHVIPVASSGCLFALAMLREIPFWKFWNRGFLKQQKKCFECVPESIDLGFIAIMHITLNGWIVNDDIYVNIVLWSMKCST
mmetsp:Transcript_811/g.1793  ORF Transcript_811/g.1793 Transcript_811/m.1793 type:complete len:81 (-) Transcript_811:1806-2048(-)